MKINKIQEKELNKARKLQKDCVDLHLPSPPVVSWIATIIDEKGNEIEKTIAKANSYVRNALNLLSNYVALASPTIKTTSEFKDGLLNMKSTDGDILPIINNSFNAIMQLSNEIDTEDENLNYYEVSYLNGFNYTNTTIESFFDENSRKLITQISLIATNTSTETKFITSAMVAINVASRRFLMIRDVFNGIPVTPGYTIKFTYQTEVLYPL